MSKSISTCNILLVNMSNLYISTLFNIQTITNINTYLCRHISISWFVWYFQKDISMRWRRWKKKMLCLTVQVIQPIYQPIYCGRSCRMIILIIYVILMNNITYFQYYMHALHTSNGHNWIQLMIKVIIFYTNWIAKYIGVYQNTVFSIDDRYEL